MCKEGVNMQSQKMDKEILDILKDDVKPTDLWVRVYNEKTGKQGWVLVQDIFEKIFLGNSKVGTLKDISMEAENKNERSIIH